MIEIDRLQWIEEALILCYNQYYPIEDYNSFFKNFNVFFKSQKNEKKSTIYKLVYSLQPEQNKTLFQVLNSKNENNESEITENLNKKEKKNHGKDKKKKRPFIWNKESKIETEEEQKEEEKDDFLIATKDKVLYKYLEKDETIYKVLLDVSNIEIPRKKILFFCVAIAERMQDNWKEKYSYLTSHCEKLVICIQKLNFTNNTDEKKEEGDPFEFKSFFRSREKEFDDLKNFLKEQIELAV